jgi:hypothetical protein
MTTEDNNIIPLKPKKNDSDATPIISSDWGDAFPLMELLDAIDKSKKDNHGKIL